MFGWVFFLLPALAWADVPVLQLPPTLPTAARADRDETSGVRCLQGILGYWGAAIPSEGQLGRRVLQFARQVLGDEEFVRQGRESLALPLNNPQALAHAARENGFVAQVEQRRPLGALLAYLYHHETVIVPQVFQGQLFSGVVVSIRNGRICLARFRGGRLHHDWVPLPVFERYWFNVAHYPGALIRIFPARVISP